MEPSIKADKFYHIVIRQKQIEIKILINLSIFLTPNDVIQQLFFSFDFIGYNKLK